MGTIAETTLDSLVQVKSSLQEFLIEEFPDTYKYVTSSMPGYFLFQAVHDLMSLLVPFGFDEEGFVSIRDEIKNEYEYYKFIVSEIKKWMLANRELEHMWLL